jgi:4-phytase/acid phosphatase
MRTLFALLAAALTLPLAAQQPNKAAQPMHKEAHKQAHKGEQLKFVLILSRHGVRPPLVSNAALATYATSPWPSWPVGLGQLTPHGEQAVRATGSYLRAYYTQQGLFAPTGCEGAAQIALYADTDQRDLATAADLAASMFPGCPQPALLAAKPGTLDPLFRRALLPAQDPAAAMASYRERIGTADALTARFRSELDMVTHVLAPDPAHPAATPVLSVPAAIVPGNGAVGVAGASVRGPVPTVSTLCEDFFLEYTDGKPMSDVGWGRLSVDDLRRCRNLHAFMFRTAYGDGYVARAEGSNLFSHFLDTLEAATLEAGAQSPRPSTPLNPNGKSFVIVAGHDDNLVEFGGMLNVHWKADGVTDEPTPNSEFVFELWQSPARRHQTQKPQYFVRLRFRVPTAEQIRTAEPLTLAHPLVEVPLKLPNCAAACPLADFLRIARAAVDPHFIPTPATAEITAQPAPPPSPFIP